MKNILIIFTLIFTTSNSSYILKKAKRDISIIDKMPKAIVGDMQNIPQNLDFYAQQIKPLDLKKQFELDKKFNKLYFKPWKLKAIDIPKEDFGWEVRFITKKPIYDVYGGKISQRSYYRWFKNAQYEKLDTLRKYAITIKRTDVKALPTEDAFYRDPKKVGEGFPFDYNQNSALHINIPLYISHFSKDKDWAFVRASYAFGWVKVDDIAFVDGNFTKEFENGKYAITIKDNLKLYSTWSTISLVKLGSLFPLSSKKNHYLVATKDGDMAKIEELKVEDSSIIAKKPFPFTSKTVAKIAKEFYNEPYGWGGGYGCRDCSATTRDFLAPFGIFLHRNSSQQAKDGENYFLKSSLKWSKKREIIKKAKPFFSLLYVPGHIMLYLGNYNNEPIIMHSYWGIRKKDYTKLITGRTIITSTEPGSEREDVREKSKLINTIKSVVNF